MPALLLWTLREVQNAIGVDLSDCFEAVEAKRPQRLQAKLA